MFTENLTYSAALIAGLLSFFSPCILPLIPAYFSLITGLSLDKLTENKREIRQKVILATISYVAGFSFIFILLGASASFLGGLAAQYSWLIRYIGGGIVLIFGLHLLGIININSLRDYSKNNWGNLLEKISQFFYNYVNIFDFYF